MISKYDVQTKFNDALNNIKLCYQENFNVKTIEASLLLSKLIGETYAYGIVLEIPTEEITTRIYNNMPEESIN